MLIFVVIKHLTLQQNERMNSTEAVTTNSSSNNRVGNNNSNNNNEMALILLVSFAMKIQEPVIFM